MADLERVLVHIGYHKTATSWLQAHLFDRRDRGFDPLVDAESAEVAPSKQLGRLFVYDDAGHLCSDLVFDADHVRRRIEASTDGTGVPVISNERLSGHPAAGGFDSAAIARRLHEVVPAARVLIVIREQASIILSTYHQYLRVGGMVSLGAYLRGHYDGRLPSFSPEHFCYDRLIAHYQQLFGADRVHVATFETFNRDPHSFVDALARFSGAEVPVDELDFGQRENVGRDAMAIERTRFLSVLGRRSSLNGYTPWGSSPGERAVRVVRDGLSRVTSDERRRRHDDRLRAEVEEYCAGRFTVSNQATAALTGLDLTAVGYR